MLRNGAQVLASWLSKLSQLSPELADKIIAVAAAVAMTVGVFMALVTVMKLIVFLASPLMIVFILIAALVGVTMFKAFQKVQEQMRATAATTKASTGQMKTDSGKNLGAVQQYSQDTIDKLAEIDKQMKKTTAAFRDDLAQMVRDHQAKAADLKNQIDEENASFASSQEEQVTKNQDSLDKMAQSHEEKTQGIQKDIDAELAKGRMADSFKVDSLKASLVQENNAYEAQKAKEVAAQEAQTAKDQAEHQKRLADIQVKLDAETALLVKHQDDVNSIRDVAFKDDIDKLKEKYAEQMQQYEEDKSKAIKADQEKSGAFNMSADNVMNKAREMSDSVNNSLGNIGGVDLTGTGSILGKDMGRAFLQAFKEAAIDLLPGAIKSVFGLDGGNTVFGDLKEQMGREGVMGVLKSWIGSTMGLIGGLKDKIPGFANGVQNFGGGWAVTGEQGAELVHLPKGSDVYSNSESKRMLGNAGGTTIQRQGDTVHVSIQAGAFMGTPGDARRFADMVNTEIRKLQVIRGGAS